MTDYSISDWQAQIQEWALKAFGSAVTLDIRERCYRFLEEAIELVQALGCTCEDAHKLVDYVFGRPVGNPTQEVGGVMVTLAVLASAAGVPLSDAASAEHDRIWQMIEQIRAKQAAKPIRSPLPGCVVTTQTEITGALNAVPERKVDLASLPDYGPDSLMQRAFVMLRTLDRPGSDSRFIPLWHEIQRRFDRRQESATIADGSAGGDSQPQPVTPPCETLEGRCEVSPAEPLPAVKPNCQACRYCFMEPDDDFCCGHADAGPVGTYIRLAAAEGGHCGPSRPKFQQHPLRNPDGSLKS